MSPAANEERVCLALVRWHFTGRSHGVQNICRGK